MRTLFLLLALGLVGCAAESGAPDDGESVDESAEQDLVTGAKPSLFVLQFTGTYKGRGGIASLVLRANGAYALTRSNGTHENGRYSAGSRKTTPLTVRFVSGAHRWSGRIAGFDGKLDVDAESLTLQRTRTSDEELCDRTRGHWTDDDADRATGLYCVCGAGRAFVPAKGGCIADPR